MVTPRKIAWCAVREGFEEGLVGSFVLFTLELSQGNCVLRTALPGFSRQVFSDRKPAKKVAETFLRFFVSEIAF